LTFGYVVWPLAEPTAMVANSTVPLKILRACTVICPSG
jgi:hypothetical protein